MGNGQWDFAEYMRVNHDGIKKVTIKGVNYKINTKKGTFTPAAPPSRYDLYRWEIETNSIPDEGVPQCHSSGPSTTVEDRRIIHTAVLNCGAIQSAMNAGTLSSGDALPVETFAKVCITKPMDVGNQAIIWGEIFGPVI